MAVSSYELEEIVEGRTRLLVPSTRNRRGPGKRGGVFYNEVMKLNRDVAVSFLNSVPKYSSKKAYRVLDGMAATGALGLRLANEVKAPLEVVLNDRNPLACEIIGKNRGLNSLDEKKVAVENASLNAILSESSFDYIDIDPFGSPIPFLDSAFQSIENGGYLGITATDKASMCGVYPKACMRKYQARPLQSVFSDEVGLRILIGYCVRTAAKYDLAVHPVLTYSTQHYYRLYLRAERGAKKADELLEKMTYASYNSKTGDRALADSPSRYSAGPLWGGPMMSSSAVKTLKVLEGMRYEMGNLIELWKEEANSLPLYYTSDEVSMLLNFDPPPMEKVLRRLKRSGFAVSRTHFSPTGFKTNATVNEMWNVLRT